MMSQHASVQQLNITKKGDYASLCDTGTVADQPTIGNLFFPVPDTDFRDFLDEVAQLLRFAPEIITAIEGDLDAHALAKKKLRLEDRKFFDSRTEDLPELEIEERDRSIDALSLEIGRPRMSAEAVYVFLMLRGFLGSLSTKQSRRFLCESMSLYGWLQSRGLTMPGVSTILDNLNVISQKTRELIFDRQIARILGEGLDDFKALPRRRAAMLCARWALPLDLTGPSECACA